MAACVNFSGADTLRERVWGEFAELSPGGERAGTAEGRRGWGGAGEKFGHTCHSASGQPVGLRGAERTRVTGVTAPSAPVEGLLQAGGCLYRVLAVNGGDGPPPPRLLFTVSWLESRLALRNSLRAIYRQEVCLRL